MERSAIEWPGLWLFIIPMDTITLEELELSIQIAEHKYLKAVERQSPKRLLRLLKEDIDYLSRLKSRIFDTALLQEIA